MLADRSAEQFARLRVLDPACGDGAFLRGVLRFCDRNGVKQPPGLHGVDVDPGAIAAARSALGASARLRRADWLAPGGARQRWDAIVGNPPWVGVKAIPTEVRRQLGAAYTVATGQFDLMAVFVERALTELAPGGRAALLLPDRWLLNRDGEPLRRLVLQRGGLQAVVRLGEGRFPGVSMPALLAVLQPDAGASPTVVRDGPQGSPRAFNVARFAAWDQARLPLHLSPCEVERAEQLATAGVPLGTTVTNGRGVEVGKRSEHVRDQAAPGFAPILFGEDIGRYHLGVGRHVRLGAAGLRYKSPALYAPPKILLRKTGLGIRAAVDHTDRLVSQVVYVLRPDPADAHWLLGVLNSATLSFLHRARNGEADKRSFPHLRQGDVLALAIPGPDRPGRAQIAAAAAERMSMTPSSSADSLDREIDALVKWAYAG